MTPTKIELARIDRRLSSILAIARQLGIEPTPGQRILDFGCGNGFYTIALRRQGLESLGVDVWNRSEEAAAICLDRGDASVFSIVSLDNYQLPYPDNHFDFMFSDHVFEHVSDYDTTLREMRRVLRPGGVSINIFPSRYRILESHLKIPFAGFLRARPWLSFWHVFGNRGFSTSATQSTTFLETRTNYLSKRELSRHFSSYFNSVRFVEASAIRAQGHPRFAFLAPLVSTFHVRVVALS